MASFDQKVNITVETDVRPGSLGKAVKQLGDLDSNLDGLGDQLDDLEGSLNNLDTDELEESVGDLEDIEINPKFGEVDTSQSKGRMSASAHRHVRDVNKTLTRLHPKFGEVDISRSKGLMKIDANSHVRETNETLETLDPKIGADVKWGNGGSNRATAAANYNAKMEAFEQGQDVKEIDPQISSNINFDSLQGFEIPDGVSEDLEEVESLLTSIRDVNEANKEALETAQELKEGKADLREEQKKLDDQNKETTESELDEAKSFTQAMGEAEGLAEAKRAATESNRILNEANEETTRSTLKESGALEKLNMDAQELGEELGVLTEKQSQLTDANEDSSESADVETRSFEDMIDGAESLADAKQAVTNSNRRLENQTGKTNDELIEEEIQMGNLSENARRLKSDNDSLSDTTRSVTRSIRRMRDATDDSSESMRAAAEVGDLFEDGLGSLSVNLGAFTIALRNFLTQVPLLLTALGALGAAALGAAASFTALAGAMAGLVGVGLLAHAQDLNSQFSQIEGLGQSLEVIMRNVFDVFLEALKPLSEMNNISSYFTKTIEGLASGINMLSNSIAFLTTGSEEFVDSASNIPEDMYTIQDAIDSFDGSTWEELTGAIMESWIILGEEVTWALGTINSALADAIARSSQLLSEVENVGDAMSQFGDTMSELAEFGFTIGSGLLPVFESFSSIVESVAGAINEMDDQMVANLVTFAAIFMASQKVAGTMASMVRVIPSVVTGLKSISAASAGADTALGGMKLAMSGVMSNVGQFLTTIGAFGGLSDLMLAVDSTGEAFREIAFNSAEAQAQFQALALGSDVTSDELSELAAKGLLTEQQIDALADETNELNDELMKTQLNASLAGESFDDIDADDVDIGDVDVDADGIIDPEQFKTTSNAVDGAKDSLVSMSKSTKRGAKAAEASVISHGLLSTLMKELSLSTIKARIAQYGYIGALKKTVATVATAITQKVLMIAANWGLVSSELAATSATVLLDAAITSLTGGLNKVIPAIIGLIVALGALTVGVLENMDGIKSAFSGMFQVIKAIVGGIVDLLMVTFMSVWDALRMTIEPLLRPIKTIMMALGGTGDAADESSGAISILSTAFEALLGVISFTIRSIGVLGKIFTTVFTLPVQAAALSIGMLIDLLQWISGKIGTWVASWSVFQEFFDDTSDSTIGLIEVISVLFDHTIDVMKSLAQRLENFINNVLIGGINDVISMINKVPGFNVAQMSEIDITRDEAIGSDEPDVDPKRDNQITYNEDNSTNIDQTVNADPEDQAQLSRVVSDAIAEANSFERRRQGGQ